jgi:RimJ/RimL family protein N-acetyltransferase
MSDIYPASMQTEYVSERLSLRKLSVNDAEFIFDLVNQPSWLKYIGDRNVHSIEDAVGYIEKGPMTMYQQYGFGLFLVQLRENEMPIGLCGILKRDTLEHPDIGFAFLPSIWGKGYAFEAAHATLQYAKEVHQFEQVLAITTQDNMSSIKLLNKLGMQFERLIQLSPEDEILNLFSIHLEQLI